MRIEKWNGHDIRFVLKDKEWWSVLADVANALDLEAKHIKARLTKEFISTARLKTCDLRTMEVTYESRDTQPVGCDVCSTYTTSGHVHNQKGVTRQNDGSAQSLFSQCEVASNDLTYKQVENKKVRDRVVSTDLISKKPYHKKSVTIN
jgi:hypothetical protein